jgi:hypothetical protein
MLVTIGFEDPEERQEGQNGDKERSSCIRAAGHSNLVFSDGTRVVFAMGVFEALLYQSRWLDW